MNVPHLQLGISDAALMASSDGAYGEVELRPSRKFADSRLSALVAAARAEMVAGFGRRLESRRNGAIGRIELTIEHSSFRADVSQVNRRDPASISPASEARSRQGDVALRR